MSKIKENIELENIINHIENITEETIIKKTHLRKIVYLRVVYAILAIKYTKESLGTIGRFINKDHATIIHYRDKLSTLVVKDEYYFDIIDSYNPKHKGKLVPKNKFSRVLTLCRDLTTENKKLRNLNKKLKNTKDYTQNELAYRNLSPVHQEVFNTRVEAMLKMMTYDRCI